MAFLGVEPLPKAVAIVAPDVVNCNHSESESCFNDVVCSRPTAAAI